MTNEELYDRILVKVRRPGDAIIRAFIEDELTELLQEWERGPFHPWFLEKRSSGLTAVVDTHQVNLPSDFLLQVEDTDLYLVDSEGERELIPRGYHEDLESRFLGEDSALPEGYDIFGGQLWFGPSPDEAYEIQLKYYKTTTPPPDTSASVSNEWVLNAQGLVVAAASERLMRTYIKDTKRATEFAAEAAQKMVSLHKYHEARAHANMDYRIDR